MSTPEPLADPTIYRTRRDVRHRHLPPEAIVVRQEAAEVLVLNDTAGRVLGLLDGQRSASDVARQLAGEYTGGAQTDEEIARDVQAFLRELEEAGVVEIVR